MDLATFSANFEVSVINIVPDIDNGTTKIGFKVLCPSNKRVGIFLEDVVLENLSEGYTTQDIIDAAWTAQIQNIHDWAIVNLPHTILSEYVPETTTSDISLSTFNNNFNVLVSRYELYPADQPQSWCIALVVSHKTKHDTIYRDCTLPTTAHCNNVLCVNVVTAAWDILKANICSWAKDVVAESDLLNTSYTSSNWVS